MAQPEADTRLYIARYKELAKSEQQRSGIPAAIKLAQGIYESAAGKSDLASRSNNHFGIKCKSSWRGDTVLHDDDLSQECFRKYPSVEKSYMDHSDFLKGSPRYAKLFTLNVDDYIGWATGLKQAGYATNPAYVRKITDLIERYELQQYTLEAQKGARLNNEASTEKAWQEAQTVNDTVQALATTTYKGLKGFWASKGTNLLDKSVLYNVKYSKLLQLNDLPDAPLSNDMFVYVEPKRTQGQSEFHTVREGESMLLIAQKEAMRLDSLMAYNNLLSGQEVMPGEKVALIPGKISFPKTRDNGVAGKAAVTTVIPVPVKTEPMAKTETIVKTEPVAKTTESVSIPVKVAPVKEVPTPVKAEVAVPAKPVLTAVNVDSVKSIVPEKTVVIANVPKPVVDTNQVVKTQSAEPRVVRDTVLKVQRGNVPQTAVVRKEGTIIKTGNEPVNLTPAKPVQKKEPEVIVSAPAPKVDSPIIIRKSVPATSSDIIDIEKARRTEALLSSAPLTPVKTVTAPTTSNVPKTESKPGTTTTTTIIKRNYNNDPNLSTPVKDLKKKFDQIVYDPVQPAKRDSVKSPTYGVTEKKDVIVQKPTPELPAHLKSEPAKPEITKTEPVKPTPPPVRMRPAEVIIPTTNYDEPTVSDTLKTLRRKFDMIVNTPLPERPYKESPPVNLPKSTEPAASATAKPNTSNVKPATKPTTKAVAKPAAKPAAKTTSKPNSAKAPVKKKK